MIIKMEQVAGSQVLAGALNGRRVLADLIRQLGAEPNLPEIVYLDFCGVSVATASFLRESVLEFRGMERGRGSKRYPVIANANESVIEELTVLLNPRRDALLSCELHESGRAENWSLIGDLEPKQLMTYEILCTGGETDASTLSQNYKGEDVGQTAWNNRLASLAKLGLVVEINHGRSKRYQPLIKEN